MTNALGPFRAEGGIWMRQDGREEPDSSLAGRRSYGVPWTLCSVVNAI